MASSSQIKTHSIIKKIQAQHLHVVYQMVQPLQFCAFGGNLLRQRESKLAHHCKHFSAGSLASANNLLPLTVLAENRSSTWSWSKFCKQPGLLITERFIY